MMTIDFDRLRVTLLPHVLRQGGLIEALFKSAYKPLKTLYSTLTAYVAQEERERTYGPTVKQLRQALADHLGISLGAVAIGDVQPREQLNLWRAEVDGVIVSLWKATGATAQQRQSLWSDDMVWWNRDFTVTITGMSDNDTNRRMVEAILDRWKMVSSQYTITFN